MPDLLIRNLKAETIEHYKGRARRKGRSLQAEVQALLELEEESDRAREEAFWASVWAFRDSLKGGRHSDSAELIREDRDER